MVAEGEVVTAQL